ncbi:MAG: hypothetical protein A2289_21585 [Deltaproteobacteria bacterium RIFOXYA12_FULL_58_15]|nr:MAG: hypothetical protein A2289_21585 [Deltaproteobacteria bacterium RIFOXYA12_FULL_58_15]OGR15005.1 MAG: hypothetical protein A2341_17845 [Deltaproteobacteria bacterium RIFOXYB12_FULL_58_9]
MNKVQAIDFADYALFSSSSTDGNSVDPVVSLTHGTSAPVRDQWLAACQHHNNSPFVTAPFSIVGSEVVQNYLHIRNLVDVRRVAWHGLAPIVSEPGDGPTPLPTRGKVASVYDGDTFTLVDRDINVRVQNVNTPEKQPLEDMALEARDLTKSLVLGPDKEVRLVFDENMAHDSYGRIVAQVLLPDGSDLAEHLLENGLGHLFVVGQADNPGDIPRLLAAQERARFAGHGIWALERYQANLNVTSFHANGNGSDVNYPNGEYFRFANITSKPLQLGGYTIENAAGRKFTLPNVEVRPGHTVQVFSGVGENRLEPSRTVKLYLGSEEPIWNNFGDVLTIKDSSGEVVTKSVHRPLSSPVDLTRLANPITQKMVQDLGPDIEAVYSGPERIKVGGTLLVDDGDTAFMKSPPVGTFKVTLKDGNGISVTRDVQIADQGESPQGMLAIRFVGTDTPETHFAVSKDGETMFYSQGRAAENAAERLYELLKQARAIEVAPLNRRPFDAYNRLLGTVFATMADGKEINVNQWMVEQGLAEMSMTFPSYGEFNRDAFAAMSAASKVAYTKGRGIYSDGEGQCKERPVEFRRRLRQVGTAQPFVVDMHNGLVYAAAEIDRVAPHDRLFVYQPQLQKAMDGLGLHYAPSFP